MSLAVFSNSTRIEKIISSKDMFLRIFLCFMGLVFCGKKFKKKVKKINNFCMYFIYFLVGKVVTGFYQKIKIFPGQNPNCQPE
jgi:hypothetical protein